MNMSRLRLQRKNKNIRLNRTHLEIENLEDRYLLSVEYGIVTGSFVNAYPSSAVINGLETTKISWGTPVPGSTKSSVSFFGNAFVVNDETPFSLGTINFHNGTTYLRTSADSIDLQASLSLFTENGTKITETIDLPLSISTTRNTGENIVADSDYITMSNLDNISFNDNSGNVYKMEIIGFGNLNKNGLSTNDKLGAYEGESVTAELFARIITEPYSPDLATVSFEYYVPDDATSEKNGPLPINLEYTVNIEVENKGNSKSDVASIGIYLSKDQHIDPNTDILLSTDSIPPLLPGEQSQTQLQMKPPTEWSTSKGPWWGNVYIGVVIDPQSKSHDIDRSNNLNQGLNIDSQSIQLYDAKPTVSIPVKGVSYFQAVVWLITNGFHPTPLYTGSGWSNWLPYSETHFSPFDGHSRPGWSYRQNAFIEEDSNAKDKYQIRLQGTFFNSEPNPESAILNGWKWFSYVYDWHKRF